MPLWPKRRYVVLAVCASIIAGLGLASYGFETVDTRDHASRGAWIFQKFVDDGPLIGTQNRAPVGFPEWTKWYGPLWEIAMAPFVQAFRFLRNDYWLRGGLTFALFPLSLLFVFAFIADATRSRATGLLAAAMIAAHIRLGGHALVNTNDFPLAIFYLLVTLYLWKALREGARPQGYTWKQLAWLSFVALVPYLVRPPVLVHAAALMAYMTFFAMFSMRRATLQRRVATVIAPAFCMFFYIWFLYPPVWEYGWGKNGWLGSFRLFSMFPLIDEVRLFGSTYTSNRLPWWYPLAWPLVGVHLLAVLAAVAGIAAGILREKGPGLRIPLGKRFSFDVPLFTWLAFFALTAWAGVLLKQPVLYDEDRHLLFLVPPLLLMGALGLSRILSERARMMTAGAIAAAALVSYASWGRYAYVYKSPVIGDTSASRFMGDYWGVCISPAMKALQGRVPAGSNVVIQGPYWAATMIRSRMTDSPVFKVPGWGPYHLTSWRDPRPAPPYAIIAYNRIGAQEKLAADIAAGRARLLWEDRMPPGDPACMIASYP